MRYLFIPHGGQGPGVGGGGGGVGALFNRRMFWWSAQRNLFVSRGGGQSSDFWSGAPPRSQTLTLYYTKIRHLPPNQIHLIFLLVISRTNESMMRWKSLRKAQEAGR